MDDAWQRAVANLSLVDMFRHHWHTRVSRWELILVQRTPEWGDFLFHRPFYFEHGSGLGGTFYALDLPRGWAFEAVRLA